MTKQDRIDSVIFDLGKVLIDWEPSRAYCNIFRTKIAINHFLSVVTTAEWNEAQDRGRSISEANKYLIAKFPEYKYEILAYYNNWEADMLGGAIEGSVRILKYFIESSEFRVFALTNFSDETFPIALAKFDFLSWFEDILVSGVVKLKKPEPEIYQMAINRFQIIPEKTLFIDDSLKNVIAARMEGLNAIHFIDPEQLQNEMEEYGIKIH